MNKVDNISSVAESSSCNTSCAVNQRMCTSLHHRHIMHCVCVCVSVSVSVCVSVSVSVCVCSSVSDDSKQQGSELSEKLKLSGQENVAMRAELEELRKRLEMADLMLQQVLPPTPLGRERTTATRRTDRKAFTDAL